MVRPYAVRGLKRNRNDAVDGNQTAGADDNPAESPAVHTETEEWIPSMPSEEERKPGVVFVLQKASLEFAMVGKTYQLLNSDDHVHHFKKHNLDPADYRPDITHQALLAILDSPLNKSGRLKALYVHTVKDVVIQVNPQVRLPRVFKRFSGVILQVLQNKNVRADNGSEFLLRKVSKPVTRHFPADSRRIGFSFTSSKVVPICNYVSSIGDDVTPVFVVGAMAKGKIDTDYIDDMISVSGYALSASCCINRICYGLEQKWKIL